MKYYGLLLLGFWLIARSLFDLFNFHFTQDNFVLACVALVAGVLLSVHELKAKLESTGILLLGIWLVAGSSMTLFRFTFPSSNLIMAILGSLAGLLLIVRK